MREEQSPMSDTQVCPKCKKSNPASNVACIWCGAMLMYQRLQAYLGFLRH